MISLREVISKLAMAQLSEDVWMGDVPLSHQYAALYNIVHDKNVLVSIVLASEPLNISFRRGLNDNKWLQWIHLCQRLITINLTTESDKFFLETN
jgi:predicted phosphoadenosine phosphosulfate sulfurtransferase